MMEKRKLKQALDELKHLSSGTAAGDEEDWHLKADEILVDLLKGFGCPKEIIEAYDSVEKWYS